MVEGGCSSVCGGGRGLARTVAVTGAAGHLGGNLVRSLLAQGRRVRVVLRNDARAIDGLPVERVVADVLDPVLLRAALDGAEVVYHLAARVSISSSEDAQVLRTNVEGTRNVVEACRACGVRRHTPWIKGPSSAPREAHTDRHSRNHGRRTRDSSPSRACAYIWDCCIPWI